MVPFHLIISVHIQRHTCSHVLCINNTCIHKCTATLHHTQNIIHTFEFSFPDFSAYDQSDVGTTDSCLSQNHDTSLYPAFATVSQSLTDAAQATMHFEWESVKMAVLIRWRIRAVVFNQSSQWQSLWWSRGDCDDDSCWRGSTENTHALWFVPYGAEPTQLCLCWEQHSGNRRGRQKEEAAETHGAIRTRCWS